MKYVNYASWIPSLNAPLEVDTAPFPQPDSLGEDELIIKNKAVAINPVDWKIRDSSDNRFGLAFPYILGEDVAGEVLYVGSGVQDLFAKGDRVLAYAVGLGAGDTAYGGFQHFVKAKALVTARIPDGLTFAEAVVLPLSVSTAAAGLYVSEALGLRLPRVPGSAAPVVVPTASLLDAHVHVHVDEEKEEEEEKKKKKKETLLVWGGSSSVGSSVVQLAVASGYHVVATASAANYGYVKSLGASLVLDYHNPDIVPLLTALLRSQQPSTVLVGAYDAIGTDITVRQTAAVLAGVVHGSDNDNDNDSGRGLTVASVGVAPTDVAGGVRVTRVLSSKITADEPEVATAVWGQYVPAALKIGQLLPRPRELIIGTGLDYVQAGLDRNKKGVSAAKVVVTL